MFHSVITPSPVDCTTGKMFKLLSVVLALAVYVSCAPEIQSKLGLNTVAKQHRKLYFGTATNNEEFTNDTAYRNVIKDNRMFGQLTAANVMKWESTEPNPGQFTFADADQFVHFAQRNGQILRGHNCVWHQQLPSWVVNGTFTESEILAAVERHCGTLVGRYRGQIYSWDVVNEVINDDGTFRQDVFFNSSGTKYIAAAFHAAKAADPHAKLYANDFNIEGPGPKATAYHSLIKQLKKEGVPIDGLGFQAHLVVGQLPPNIKENLESFTRLGVEVALTELDIRMTLPSTPELVAQQKKDYATVISACNAVKGCIGVTVWDFTDKYSWVPGTFTGEGNACPWDDNLQKKPAFFGIIDGFKA